VAASRLRRATAFAVVLGLLAVRGGDAAASDQTTLALAVRAAQYELAGGELWPGFAPRQVPLAIYDGEQTWLFGHPTPPAPFVAVDSLPGTWVRVGRHPEVVSNTSVTLAGTPTATLMLQDRRARPPDSTRALAAVAIHESFHVFQRAHHPGWSPNEGELFLYPADDESLLAGVNLELEALRRAVADTTAAGAGWAAAALEVRRARFARQPAGSVLYERGSEWNEGLADYVQNRALRLAGDGDPRTRRGPGTPGILSELAFPPDAVRRRSYVVGEAWAVLLDRFRPGWRDSLEVDDTRPLDALLATALAARDIQALAFTNAERRAAEEAARANAAEVRSRRTRARQEFLARDGFTLVVEAGDEPLWPQGFDPWNTQSLGSGEVLHARWVKLQNTAGSIEVLGRAALTASAGTHPLFEGVRRLTLTGLEAAPDLQALSAGEREIAPGVHATFSGARIERHDNETVVKLPR